MISYWCIVRNITELETVISLTVHKSIYRHMFLWLEIDFIPVYCEGYYGTRIERISMILADKIIALRRQRGWSQEELAGQLGVSRQAVSKWESASAIPDLERILKMSQIFEVSTDYLLKEELEELEISADGGTEPEEGGKSVSLEEASSFMEQKKRHALSQAIAIAAYTLCPVFLIFLAGYSELASAQITEEAAAGIGLVALLLMIGVATVVVVLNDAKLEKYEYLKKGNFRLQYGVEGIVKKRQEEIGVFYRTCVAAGTFLFITAALPIFLVMIFLGENDFFSVIAVDVMLLLVAVGVFLIVWSGEEWSACQILLREGEFTPEEQSRKPIFKIYWCVVTALYLGISFWTFDWHRTWMIWPCAGVLSGALRVILRIRRGAKE